MKNCRLKKANFKDDYETRMYGFMLMAKGKKFEFFSDKEDDIAEWIDALKSDVIMLGMREVFNIEPK